MDLTFMFVSKSHLSWPFSSYPLKPKPLALLTKSAIVHATYNGIRNATPITYGKFF